VYFVLPYEQEAEEKIRNVCREEIAFGEATLGSAIKVIGHKKLTFLITFAWNLR
jgi:hypothetical protein